MRIRSTPGRFEMIPGGTCQYFYFNRSPTEGGSWNTSTDPFPGSGTTEWIVDEHPHAFGVLSKCEHFKLTLQAPPLSHTPRRNWYFSDGYHVPPHPQDGEYRTVSGGGIQQSNRYCTLRANHRHQALHATTYDPSAPLWARWYSELEVRNNLADLKARLANWSIGRSGLAESVGEIPECPKLMQLRLKGKSLIASSSGVYLQGVFGWRPLLALLPDVLKEIQNVKRHLDSSASRALGTRTLVFRKKIRSPWSDDVRTTIQLNEYPQTHVTEGSIVANAECEMQYLVQCEVSRKWGNIQDTMSHLASVGGIPSLITCWELIPCSFLVDYIVHVGDLIARLQGNLLYDINVTDQAWALKANVSGTDYTETPVQGRPAHWIANYQMFYYSRSKDTWALPVAFGFPNSTVLPSTAALLGLRFPRLRSNTLNRLKRDIPRAWNQMKKSFSKDPTSGFLRG